MRGSERGTGLILALVVLTAAASLGALLLERGRSLKTATEADREALQALYAAEGGLAYARHALSRDPFFAGETIRVGGREVVVNVDERGELWRVVVRVRGARLDATLRRGGPLPEIAGWRIDRPAG